MDQERKKRINEELKKVKKDFENNGGALKYSLRVRHHSTIVLTIRECSLDLLTEYYKTVNENNGPDFQVPYRDYAQVNHYHLDRQFTGESLELMKRLNAALHLEHWDESDMQVDYFNCAYYTDINLGDFDKPYKVK